MYQPQFFIDIIIAEYKKKLLFLIFFSYLMKTYPVITVYKSELNIQVDLSHCIVEMLLNLKIVEEMYSGVMWLLLAYFTI